ncbi:right-handed parallel beta-helix repeat-containing protein [Solirubrobacter phytolaccae]|uniref:Right-handed parallel beta-helix repeat-containing protein n=1 Tax=Solirubrobacter phytolaccae TaxID=1404360 RepID=A0A9X3NB30_9ACTN|nr:choice-of-anchor Q domain-containing protein [Solirubrobacter phytolaccae]MDA0181839.1 right-handed parallel beta-helix repeat-containing protein [Solirubrobacter phytolaccae]
MKRALLTLAAALAFAAPASAATFTVTTTTDSGGSCPPIRQQQCTLRTALGQAAQNSEADTITLPAGTYELNPQLGELTISGEAALLGAGAGQTTIRSPGGFRVFSVASGGGNAISGVTITGGTATSGSETIGGNVEMAHGADLALDHVRITGGTAFRGGGIATGGGGSLEIRHSLIDNNVAQPGGQSPLGDGGGILMRSNDNPQTLLVADTTIAFNRASRGAGITATEQNGNQSRLERVTVADNAASVTTGGGLLITDQQRVEVRASIFARNTGNFSQAASLIGPSNCGPTRPTSAGANVESGADCGFERQNTTGGLAVTLTDGGGQTPVLALPWTSDVHDFAGGCDGTDQRDVARPQGAGCDPGAYEATEPPPPPQATPVPTAVATQTPTATPPPAPTPVVNQTIVVAPGGGTVLVKLKGASQYAPLDVTKGIPVGSTVDTRKGRVRLTSIPKAGAPPQTALFYDGLFKVTQKGGITDLQLVEPLAACPKGRASAAAKKAKKRKLWGDGKGAFRTSGKYSAATVRGTKWLVEDSCAGTLTRVAQGSVRVTHGKRTIVVRAGKRYLARPNR